MEREIISFDMTTGRTKLNKRNVIMKAHWVAVRCKFCGEQEKVVHYGYSAKGTQRYLCRECGRTFLDNAAKGRMQYPIEAVASALNLFYESASLSEIRRQLKLTYGVSPDDSTIYRWIVRFSQKATKNLANVPVKAGATWIADETVIKLKEKGGSKQWFWDAIDSKTRFLLASHLSEGRTIRDAQTLMERAARRANRIPKTVITDKLASYLDGVELAFGAETKHIRAKKLTAEPGTQLIERFHGTLKSRTKVMRSLWRKGTAKIVMDGWLVHYNFFRPHQALGGKTPAEAADAESPFKSWKDVVQGGESEGM
jgi:transposase-like protein